MSQIDNAFETTMEKLWENKKYNTLRDVLVTMQPRAGGGAVCHDAG